MEQQQQFSELVSLKLGHYVYRLIDLRNGMTFYVGRVQGNRVFSHAAGQEKPTDSEVNEALKLRTIWAVRNAGFEVQHVIHRHGMNEESAKEVESALIDAYPGRRPGSKMPAPPPFPLAVCVCPQLFPKVRVSAV